MASTPAAMILRICASVVMYFAPSPSPYTLSVHGTPHTLSIILISSARPWPSK